MIKTEFFCPLGSKCEEIKGDEVLRCRWLVEVKGKHPQSEEMISETNCAMHWLPILVIENAQTNRGQTKAIEILREEVLRQQQASNFFLTALRELGNGIQETKELIEGELS